jgi:hypothetical protein
MYRSRTESRARIALAVMRAMYAGGSVGSRISPSMGATNRAYRRQ